MDNLPPLRALQIFNIVGRCGGIAEAARRLGISTGAVSQQMKILEDSLGMSLTVKDGKRIRLTAVGERYHRNCAAAFESLQVGRAEVELAKNTSNLRVSGLPSLMSKWLVPQVYTWQDRFPHVDLFLEARHAEPATDGYAIDFRITYGDGVPDTGNAIELFRDCIVPVCSPDLLDKQAPIIHAEQLLEYPLLSVDWLPSFASPPSWRDWFDAQQVDCATLNDGHRVFSLSSMAIQAAIENRGFVLAQYAMVCADLEAGHLVMPLARPLFLPSSYYLIWSNNAFEKPWGRDFHRWLVARGKDQHEANQRLYV
ncbi:LysR substrate-binding domain-containing protein [Pseudomonas sp. MWU16-30317]|uniref:LysR substrate-binding domain-containing protein n=1 Tax=Pseudomonas sp. MWU16-30317 TaxID=2878095 RepID=UPI001CF96551|nr:LysR substrate-binding domain-containing protein [Pseudomonas sp. MWU16-30317]